MAAPSQSRPRLGGVQYLHTAQASEARSITLAPGLLLFGTARTSCLSPTTCENLSTAILPKTAVWRLRHGRAVAHGASRARLNAPGFEEFGGAARDDDREGRNHGNKHQGCHCRTERAAAGGHIPETPQSFHCFVGSLFALHAGQVCTRRGRGATQDNSICG